MKKDISKGAKQNLTTGAIILAAGQGNRMRSDVAKQYLVLHGRPVLYYSLKAFEEAEEIDFIVLVVGADEHELVMEKIVKKYGFTKVRAIVTGGPERYVSVYKGLQAVDCDYVFIHDGARPMVDGDMIRRTYDGVRKYQAVVAGMPVKDTIKIADETGFIKETPRRELTWAVQTPQVFETKLVKTAYQALMDEERGLSDGKVRVTDDAMVVETYTGAKVKLIEGSYENIKITTPEDMEILDVFAIKRKDLQVEK